MKMQFVLFCGCLATRMVDVHTKGQNVVTVTTRIYQRPKDGAMKFETNHSNSEYFRITRPSLTGHCNEHFPVETLPHHCEACGSLLNG